MTERQRVGGGFDFIIDPCWSAGLSHAEKSRGELSHHVISSHVTAAECRDSAMVHGVRFDDSTLAFVITVRTASRSICLLYTSDAADE